MGNKKVAHRNASNVNYLRRAFIGFERSRYTWESQDLEKEKGEIDFARSVSNDGSFNARGLNGENVLAGAA